MTTPDDGVITPDDAPRGVIAVEFDDETGVDIQVFGDITNVDIINAAWLLTRYANKRADMDVMAKMEDDFREGAKGLTLPGGKVVVPFHD